MRVMRLEIDQQRAQINIEIQQARLHVEMPDRRMEITQTRPEMTTHLENGKVELDMDALKANTGLKTYAQMISEAAAEAKAEAQQGVADIVRTSKYISDVTIYGNKVAGAARADMLEVREPVMGHSPVPPGAVKMNGKPGALEIKWSGFELTIDWLGESTPEVYVEPPGSVNVELSTQPSVKINAAEVYIPESSGRNVNTKA